MQVPGLRFELEEPGSLRFRDRQALEQRITALEEKTSGSPSPSPAAATGGAVSFLFCAFCALWAQNTGRSPWLWFFFGSILTVIAAIVLLIKNSGDRKTQNPRTFAEGRRLG
jgi:hypothetical protein